MTGRIIPTIVKYHFLFPFNRELFADRSLILECRTEKYNHTIASFSMLILNNILHFTRSLLVCACS